MRVSRSRHLNGFLVESLESLFYYWIGKVVLTSFGYFENFVKACCGKRNKFMKLVEYIFSVLIIPKLKDFTRNFEYTSIKFALMTLLTWSFEKMG